MMTAMMITVIIICIYVCSSVVFVCMSGYMFVRDLQFKTGARDVSEKKHCEFPWEVYVQKTWSITR